VFWGQAVGADSGVSRVGRYSGGGVDTDGVNVQTKQMYVSFKVPETPLAFVVGLQGFADNYSGVLYDIDGAGVTGTANLDMASVKLGWAKFSEGNFTTEDDDRDWYFIGAALKPMQGLSVGADVYYDNDHTSSTDQYWVGINGAYSVSMVDLSGWFLYNGGTIEATGGDVDIQAFAASVKAAAKMAGANVALRLVYMTGDDDAGDDKDESFNTVAPFQFTDSYLQIAKPDLYGTGGIAGGGLFWGGSSSPGYADGSFAAILSASYVPPMMKQVYAKGALGYFMTLNGEDNGREGDDWGTEVALRLGYKVAEVVDLSLNGATVFLGSYHDGAAAGGDDPDNPYSLYAMMQVVY
jgi:hypothetical protein